MIREVILEAAGEVATVPSGSGQLSRDPGSSPYPSTNTPSVTLAECWQDDDVATYSYLHPHKNLAGSGYWLASFQAPPTLVLIRSVKVQAWWSYSQMGANNWYFPPDNAHGPRGRLVIRNRAKSANLTSSWYTIAGSDIVDRNQNISTGSPGTYLGPLLQEWETTAHPEGGPWTMDDLSVANLAAGIEFEAAAPAFQVLSGNSMFKIRCHKLRIVLEVEDLGGYVDNVRHGTAVALRLLRRARNVAPLRYLAEHAVCELGGAAYLSHPDGPSWGPNGWGRRRLERRDTQVLRRVILPESLLYEDQCFDREAYRCLLWAAYRIDAPWSPELQGLALLEKGGGFTHARAQDGWSPRPGDGVLMRVLEDYPNLSFHGLACQGADDVEVCLYNWDLMQTGWSTVGSSGDFSATADTSSVLVEEQGYLSSALLAYGAAGGQGGRERSLGTLPYASGELVHVRVVVKNTSVPTPGSQNLEVQLYRTGGGLAATEFWDEANRQWTTTTTNNPIPSSEPFGEVVFDCVPCDAAGASSDPTYYLRVGRFSSNLTSCSFNGALVNVQRSGAAAGDSFGCRTPLVTLGSTITREADVHRLPNSLAAELWSYERGVAVVEARPFWRAEDLPDAEVKPLAEAFHATDTWDALQFMAESSGDDYVRFERAVSGQPTYQLDCPIAGIDLTRAHVLRAWARWLGADGWTEYGPYSVEVGYAVFLEDDGSLVGSGSVVGTLTYTGAMTSRDYVAVGNDHQGRHADGWVRLLEVRRNPIHGLEAVWRV